MRYKDLENDGLPIIDRVKHLEREASYVRDYLFSVKTDWWKILSVISFILSLIALVKSF